MRGEGDFVGPLPESLEGIGCGEAGARTAAALRVRDDVGSMKMSISYRDHGPDTCPVGIRTPSAAARAASAARSAHGSYVPSVPPARRAAARRIVSRSSGSRHGGQKTHDPTGRTRRHPGSRPLSSGLLPPARVAGSDRARPAPRQHGTRCDLDCR